MHDMQIIATDDPVCGVSVSLCQSVCLCHAKTTERIEVLFGIKIFKDPRNIALNGGHFPLMSRGGEWEKFFPLYSTGTAAKITILFRLETLGETLY